MIDVHGAVERGMYAFLYHGMIRSSCDQIGNLLGFYNVNVIFVLGFSC